MPLPPRHIEVLLFLHPLLTTLLRHAGLAGGEDGQSGITHLVRSNGQVINLGSKATVDVLPGDKLHLLTPGGGGFGHAEDAATEGSPKAKRAKKGGSTKASPAARRTPTRAKAKK